MKNLPAVTANAFSALSVFPLPSPQARARMTLGTATIMGRVVKFFSRLAASCLLTVCLTQPVLALEWSDLPEDRVTSASFTVGMAVRTIRGGFTLSHFFLSSYEGASAIPLGEKPTFTLVDPKTGGLPPGLAFASPASRFTLTHVPQIRGTPTKAGAHLLDFSIVDGSGARLETKISVTIAGDGVSLAFDPVLPVETFTYNISGSPITDQTLPAASGGTSPYTFTLTGAPAGLSFDADTRILSGTPTTGGDSDMTYTVRDAGDTEVTREFAATVIVLGICGRTAEVHAAIVAALAATDCATVTDSQLAGIGELDLSGRDIPSLQAGDFTGFSALTYLDLDNNDFTTLPDGIFAGLNALEEIDLSENSLTTLPGDPFTGLTALETLDISANDFTTLPTGLFTDLTALETLDIGDNDFTTLPVGLFNNLTALTSLNLQGSTNAVPLADLPVALFEPVLDTLLTFVGTANPIYPVSATYSALGSGDVFEGDNLVVSVSITPVLPPFSVSVPYTVAFIGGATAADFDTTGTGCDAPSAGFLTIAAGQTSADLTYCVATDSITELDEGLTLTFGADARPATSAGVRAHVDFPVASLATLSPDTASSSVTLSVVERLDFPITQDDFALRVANGATPGDTVNLTLPAHTGGGANPVTLQLGDTDGNLPAGLTFTTAEISGVKRGILTGTPTVAAGGEYQMTYRVSAHADDTPDSATTEFKITVQADLLFDEAAKDLVLSVADAPINYTLPAISGGANPSDVTYDAGGSLGGGLSVSDGTRVIISGASPTGSANTFEITVTATDTTTGRTGMQIVSVRITNPPVLPAENPSVTSGMEKRYTYYLFNRQAINLTLPTATAGANALDTLATPLDCGTAVAVNTGDQTHFNDLVMTVAADGVSCVLTGMYPGTVSNVVRNLDMVYTATDGANQTAEMTVALRGIVELAISAAEVTSFSDLTFTKDQAISRAGVGNNRDPYVRFPRSSSTPRDNLHSLGPNADGTGNLGIPGLAFTVGVSHGNFKPPESFRLRGTPREIGTHELTYHYTLEADNDGRVENGQQTNYGQTKYDFTGQTEITRSFPVRITIAAAPNFNASFVTTPPALSYTKNFGQGDVTLAMPEGENGTPAFKYSIGTNADLAGLTFTVPDENVASLQITGTPTGAAGSHPLVWTATDAQGATATLAFQVVIVEELAFAAALPVDLEYYFPIGIAHSEKLPEVTGGQADLTFTVTPTQQLSDRMITHSSARGTLSGTAMGTADSSGLSTTYTVRDASGAEVMFTFKISIREPVTISPLSVERTYTAGKRITDFEFPSAGGAVGPFNYEYSYVPNEAHIGVLGLSLRTAFSTDPAVLISPPGASTVQHATPAVIKVIPTSAFGFNNATYTATIRVVSPLAFESGAGVDAILTFGAGTPIEPLTLPDTENGIGAHDRRLAEALDSGGGLLEGLTFDADTRVLSGTPLQSLIAGAPLTYQVTDQEDADTNNGTVSLTFTVVITGAPRFADTASIADLTLAVDTDSVNLTLPEGISGGAAGFLTYDLSGPPGGQLLPAGLLFSKTARTLAGTPERGVDSDFTYSVIDSTGASSSLVFHLTVTGAIHFGDGVVPEMTYSRGVAITPITLPPHLGSAGDTTTETGQKNLFVNGSTACCADLGTMTFTEGSKVLGNSSTLGGTPTVSGRFRFTHTIFSGGGLDSSAPLEFYIVVVDPPAFSGPFATGIPDQVWSQDLAITPLELPGATSILGATFALSGAAFANLTTLTLDGTTHVLSGEPDTAFTEMPLIWTATDSNGAASSLTFQVQVRAAPQPGAVTDPTYAAGAPMPLLTLPDITNLADGVRPLAFQLTESGSEDLSPLGLTFEFTPDSAAAGSANPSPPAVLSGTPLNAGSGYALRYSVTDANGLGGGVDFTYHVAAALVFVSGTSNVLADMEYGYMLGETIVPLTLPTATGGVTPLTYALTPVSLPANLAWSGDGDTPGVLSGSLAAGNHGFVFTATDTNGSAITLNFRISSQGPSFAGATQEDLTFEQESRANIVLPAANTARAQPTAASVVYSLADAGGAVLDDASNAVLPGLAFNANTQTLSGTPSTGRNSVALTYTATDGENNSDRLIFTVSVTPNTLKFADGVSVDSQTYTATADGGFLELPVAVPGTGIAPLIYTISALPDGLTFNANAAPPTVSGTPTTVDAGQRQVTYTVFDSSTPSQMSAALVFTMFVAEAPTLTQGDLTFTAGYSVGSQTASPLLEEVTGGIAPYVYNATGLPDGVDFETGTRTLTGVPTATSAESVSTTYTVTEDNDAVGSVTFTIQIDAPIVFDNLGAVAEGENYKPADSEVLSLNLPGASGGRGALAFALTPDPLDGQLAGLAFTAGTGAPSMITGTLTGNGGELTWTATDENGASKEYKFRVSTEGPFFTGDLEDKTYDEGQQITTLQLPEADKTLVPSGASVSYSLEGSGGEAIGTLLPGLAFNTGNRRLTGTPRSGSNEVTLVYKALDAAGNSDSRSFTVTVRPRALSFGSASIADQSYTASATIDTLNLPTASGGIADLAYTLSTGLPANLVFDGAANPPTISGTPSGTADVQLVYTVTDASTVPLTDTLTFNVFVAAAPTLTQAALTLVKGFAVEDLPTPLTLPEVAGGIAPYDYAVDGLPDGLRFDNRSRALTGAPTTEGTPNVTYGVIDTNDAVGAVIFAVTVSAPIRFAEMDGAAHVRNGGNYRVDPVSLALDAVVLTLPTAAGGSTGSVTLSLIGPDAASPGGYGGLVLDAGTRRISGSLDDQGSGGGFTWRATDSATGAYADLRFSITSEGPYFESDLANEFTFIRGERAGVQLGAANLEQVSAGPVAYTLGGLPVGMAFNAGNRNLSGTPSAPGDYTLTFAVADRAGNTDSEEIAVTVLRKLHFDGEVNDVVWSIDTALAIELPEAEGGAGTPLYTLEGTLPTGVSRAADNRRLSGTPTEAGTFTLTFAATDESGTRITKTFRLTVESSPVFTEEVEVISAPTGTTAVSETLPIAIGTTVFYRMEHRGSTDLPGTLTFNATTRVLSGNPLEPGQDQINTVLDYIASGTDTTRTTTRAIQRGDESRSRIALVVKRASVVNHAPEFRGDGPGGTGTTRAIDLGPVDDVISIPLTRYFSDPDGDPLVFSGASSSAPDIVGIVGNIDREKITLRLNSDNTADETASTADLAVTAADPQGRTADGVLRITVVQHRATGGDIVVEAFTEINKGLLPGIASAIADGNINAIAGRIRRATAATGANRAATYNLGGQSNLESIAATQAQALAGGDFDLKKLLTRSSFAVPFKAPTGSAPVKGAPERVLLKEEEEEEERALGRLSLLPASISNLNTEAAADQARQRLSTLTLWGSGAYRNVSVGFADGADPEWDGGIFSAHIGADLLLRPDLFGGLAVSLSNSEMEYRTEDDKGEHNLDMTTVSPYLSKVFYEGSLDVWGTVGLGRGELEIKSENEGTATSDVSMQTLAAGASCLFVQNDQGLNMSLNGEVIRTALEVDGGGGIESLDIESTRLRVSVAVESTRVLAGGSLLNPNMEIGLRYDTGDGESALAVQLQAGMRHFNPDTGTTLEGNAHVLLGGPEGYDEWGIEGNFIYIPQAVRALSLTITPAYGVLPGGLDQVWRQDLSDLGGDTPSDKPAPTINARLSYAIKKSGAVLTPHTEFNFGEAKRAWRTGISWGRERLFDFDLTAERREEESEDPAHTILLKGKLDF